MFKAKYTHFRPGEHSASSLAKRSGAQLRPGTDCGGDETHKKSGLTGFFCPVRSLLHSGVSLMDPTNVRIINGLQAVSKVL